MRYALAKESGELVMQAGRNHPMVWNTRAEVDKWIEAHFSLLGGLDWRVGYFFKAKFDREPLKIVFSKNGKEVKFK